MPICLGLNVRKNKKKDQLTIPVVVFRWLRTLLNNAILDNLELILHLLKKEKEKRPHTLINTKPLLPSRFPVKWWSRWKSLDFSAHATFLHEVRTGRQTDKPEGEICLLRDGHASGSRRVNHQVLSFSVIGEPWAP